MFRNFQNLMNGVHITPLNITDKQLIVLLKAKGMIYTKKKQGDFTLKSNDFLIHYNSVFRSLQFMYRNGRNFIEFANFYYQDKYLGVTDNYRFQLFMSWLHSKEQARPFTPKSLNY